MLRKDDALFKAVVDKTLIGLMKSGEAEKLYTKWFMNLILPRNVNLNFPMSPALKAACAAERQGRRVRIGNLPCPGARHRAPRTCKPAGRRGRHPRRR